MENRQATQHRLGIARTALKDIINYKGDQWEDDLDYALSLKEIAKEALEDMKREVNKKDRLRAEERDRWVERLAREVKEEVDP